MINAIKDFLLDLDWDDVVGLAGTMLIVAIVAALVYAAIDFTETERTRVETRFADCEYIGTRISDTWGQAIVYRYICDGLTEETTRRFDR